MRFTANRKIISLKKEVKTNENIIISNRGGLISLPFLVK